MKIEQKEDVICISDMQGDLVLFLMKITHEYKTFQHKHIVIDLLSFVDLTNKQVETFLSLSKLHKKAKKSFVIVAKNINFTTISDKLSVVPTKLEAFDIIDMENMERDLGF